MAPILWHILSARVTSIRDDFNSGQERRWQVRRSPSALAFAEPKSKNWLGELKDQPMEPTRFGVFADEFAREFNRLPKRLLGSITSPWREENGD
jgi:hypothetical protein